ncbi:hypothetical protein PMAYCL1PPCAC_12865, partial [Pristionchus mayeri]
SMPPKRVRATKVEDKEEEKKNGPSEDACPPTEERKARAEGKKRAALASKRALLKGESVAELNNQVHCPSPVRKKGKEGEDGISFDPMRILAQVGSRKLVDTGA